ncbi:glycerol-3-phosphate acyltransferase PlsY [Thermoflavimicrobium dichotomicum]|uniref:Glycerol-3-phosphate acyltransferase PlsY n=1 Tax=Thermoflavimicrobium dichotomicum TaxID=46223 RepID=A0A1I3RIC6_9BACL|nr:glycerol-3-phosphate acyltransferase PlsY [Thermoflavimicrobium dichotomicum]
MFLSLIDLLKGMIAPGLAWLTVGMVGAHLAAVAVVLGQIYPIWGSKRGDTGITVATGAIFILSPILILVGSVIYLFSLLVTRYMVLSVFFATLAVMLFSLVFIAHVYLWVVTISVGGLILFRQQRYWRRFRRGMEPPFRWRHFF